MNKVLLTGASHGLGRSALDALVDKNIPVTAVARNVRDLLQVQGIQVARAELQPDKYFAQIALQATDLSQIHQRLAATRQFECATPLLPQLQQTRHQYAVVLAKYRPWSQHDVLRI